MTVAQNNVTKLNQNRVYNHIYSFIEDKGNSSENTAREYETDIKQFFSYMSGKEIGQLEVEDLRIINSDILDYRSFLLKNNEYKNTTVNRKINTIRSLYVFLKANEYNVNPDAARVKNLPDDSRKIGYLTPDEVFVLADLAIQHETHNKHMKRALILTAFATSMRQDALLNLEYSDIRPCDKNTDKYIIEPNFLDKGKKIYKEIHADVYNLLIEARRMDARERTDDKIFTMDSKGICYMMKRLCEKANIDSRRNISFHSIRKAGADFVYELTGGDIFAVTAQGNWSNPKTVQDRYLKEQANMAGMAAFEKIDEDIFEQLTHEELLKMVQGIGNGLGLQLRRSAKKIVDGR